MNILFWEVLEMTPRERRQTGAKQFHRSQRLCDASLRNLQEPKYRVLTSPSSTSHDLCVTASWCCLEPHSAEASAQGNSLNLTVKKLLIKVRNVWFSVLQLMQCSRTNFAVSESNRFLCYWVANCDLSKYVAVMRREDMAKWFSFSKFRMHDVIADSQ